MIHPRNNPQIVLTVSVLSMCSISTGDVKTFQHISVEEVANRFRTDRSGVLLNSAVISTISPVVVRQDDPVGPRYHEALGYTFNINRPHRPALVQMDDGKLVLTFSIAVDNSQNEQRRDVILFSDDEGMSWSDPIRTPTGGRVPINLGGRRLMLRGESLVFSNDSGKTWSDPEPIPSLPDGRPMYSDAAMNPLVEGDTVRLVFYTERNRTEDWHKGGWTAQSFIRSYNVKTHRWDKPVFFPKYPEDGPAWRTSEGSLTRAKNGDLVVAFRSFRPRLMDIQSDHWRAISTSVSTDDGRTWSKPALHSPFGYGHVHMSLLPLPDGRILMTYAARVGELDGRVYHGIEAVVSHDNGATWDWQRRYIVYRGRNAPMHSPKSALLSNGRVLTVFMDHQDFSHKAAPRLRTQYTSVVIWSPDR